MALPRIYDEEQSKFENKSMTFHKRVREGYLKLAKREPKRWLVVDARQSIETIETAIWNKVESLLSATATDTSDNQQTLWRIEG